MIIAVGIDIIEIDRIDDSVKKFGKSFLNRIYTHAEQSECANRNDVRTYYAGRWAAKEAVSKALGCGIGQECSWLDLEILNSPSGSPCLNITGNAALKLQQLNGLAIHISISHERTNAVAMAVIEG